MPDDDANDMDEGSGGERYKRGLMNGRDNDGSRCDSETETDDDMDDESDDGEIIDCLHSLRFFLFIIACLF